MSRYGRFAEVYDLWMQETPYGDWAQNLLEIWKRWGCAPRLVLDLGCGTGNMTQLLAEKGYDMIGVDLSGEMLAKAQEKAEAKGLEILYLQQDMTEFELYGTVDAVVSICDSMNYLLEEAELLEAFRLVENYLDPGGLFIFDMNTEYKFAQVYGDGTYASCHEGYAYIWQNAYYGDEMVNEYEVAFFIREEDGRYERFDEVHQERAYPPERVTDLLEQAGLSVEAVLDADTMEPPTSVSERLYFVAKEVRKRALEKQEPME
ncbi:class I SAM-dependent DNA methyltransferase [Anaerotalea alkaliphila]|uniref:Class I SAM-dependent methyltransferase n=1 Tax=Anaerotalea alkaliphila TaxID=2662126 RepID=A0A7X5HUA6_9FIRM|nr:class I SAM-dependent methyltransferase [Anaerotalea alkaliphila]NDL66551.1 class I SAM-dependent methyltransferase [Anaerotalea alkaliphila]